MDMNTLKSNPTLLKPEVLLRFMLDTDQQADRVLAPDTWVDFDTAFGPQFQVGTEHTLTLLSPPSQERCFRVSKPPFLEQFPSADGRLMPMTTLYLAPAA